MGLKLPQASLLPTQEAIELEKQPLGDKEITK